MTMKLGVCVATLALVALSGAEKWQWPEGAASVRIDTKVHFLDTSNDKRQNERVSEEVPFKEALDTQGFYNRPRGAGRYPVRVHQPAHSDEAQRNSNYNSDGTLDSLQYCRCVATPQCAPHQDSNRACGSGKFLCCYSKPFSGNQQNTEFFNEIEDERPMLLPGQESVARPFPPPPGAGHLARPGLDAGAGRPGVLVGPGGPTGHVGPLRNGKQEVLVGPDGPTGHIGPVNQNNQDAPLTVGPNAYEKQNPGVLVGPGGPTGLIGPADSNKGLLVGPDYIDPIHPEQSAQRGVLVGPGGPTGVIGPGGGYGRRPVLVGPGGPTGFIGPRRPSYGGYFNNGYGGRPIGRGLLVGPGGPTGSIGPGRGLLVGPGGPTGMIGPQSYFG